MGEYIIIIEDSLQSAETTFETVSNLGHAKIYVSTNLKDSLLFQKTNKIKLILCDIELLGNNTGPSIVEALQKTKYIPVIYLSSTSEEKKLNEALRTNPTALIIKPFNSQQLHIAMLIAFNQVIDADGKNKNIEQPTPRELEVIEQIAKGLSNREISEVLFLSEHTIKSHRRNLLKKYSMRTTAELIALSVRHKWININKLGN